MPSYLVETYLARGQAGELSARERRARSAAQELTQNRTSVRFERSIYVPEDEICFFVFDAPSGREAVLVAQRSGLDPIRVVEALSSGNEAQTPVATACPAGYELLSVASLEAAAPYRLPRRVDAAGNNNGSVCGHALPDSVRDADCKNGGPVACILAQLGLPLYRFTDDDNPASQNAQVDQ